MKNLSGFSLMEMMVVLLIVSIVAAASAPMVNKKLVGAASEKSPWVWAGTNNNIAYNLNGALQTATIGTVTPPSGAGNARLYIETNTKPSGSGFPPPPPILKPQIAFGMNGNANVFKLAAANTGIAISNLLPPHEGVNSVVLGYRKSNFVVPDNVTVIGAEAFGLGNSTAIGYSANARSNGVAIGSEANAFGSYSTGINNIAIGSKTKAFGSDSVALGSGANAPAANSTALGPNTYAGQSNAVALGKSAYAYSTNSTALGPSAYAGYSDSVALGKSALAYSANATALGPRAYAGGFNSVAIGYDAGAHAVNAVALGKGVMANGNNAIGLGKSALAIGHNSVALGSGANVQSTNAVAIGAGAYVASTHTNSVAIGRNAATTASNQIVLGTVNDTVVVPGTIEFENLHVTGNIAVDGHALFNAKSGKTVLRRANGQDVVVLRSEDMKGGDDNMRKYPTDVSSSEQSSWFDKYISDRRLKNLGDVSKSGLDKIKKLKVFNYTFKDDKLKTPRVGVIAQDLQKVFPNAVFKGEDGFLRIRMEDMFYALVNAVKELDAKINIIEQKQKKIDQLETKVNKLEKRLSELEKRV